MCHFLIFHPAVTGESASLQECITFTDGQGIVVHRLPGKGKRGTVIQRGGARQRAPSGSEQSAIYRGIRGRITGVQRE